MRPFDLRGLRCSAAPDSGARRESGGAAAPGPHLSHPGSPVLRPCCAAPSDMEGGVGPGSGETLRRRGPKLLQRRGREPAQWQGGAIPQEPQNPPTPGPTGGKKKNLRSGEAPMLEAASTVLLRLRKDTT
ncbi:hypothetical protein NDU88_001558 [Pleurodeles waltl]|uniref:Uncharacterized protein n=1 Tax=Pleurodeles waltl TaxID=8319 RepID=A0AAV7L9U5_PLEWA|nr:hypothetical protein NDU88_001558 [Pleurodeles waltl]